MSRERLTWNAMMRRCYNKTCERYPRYGGRGIKVCDRWHDFDNFLADMGNKPKGKSIGRIDNDGDYSPLNCRWETRLQQANNTSLSRYLTYDGKTQTVMQWCRELGIKEDALRNRLAKGWSVERALTYRHKRKEWQANGQKLSDYCRQHNLCYSTVVSRLQHGSTLEDAITPYLRNKYDQLFELNGERKTIREWSAELGIPYHTLYGRYYRGIWLPCTR